MSGPHKSGLNIRIESPTASEMVALMQLYSKTRANKYIVQALTRTAQNVRTNIARSVRETHNVAYGEVLRVLRVKKAAPNSWYSSVWGWGKASIPLYAFSPRPSDPRPSYKNRPKKGVSVLVTKATGRKALTSHFVARSSKTGRFMVAQRAPGAQRFPIHQKFGPGIFGILKSTDKQEHIKQAAQRILEANLRHGLQRLRDGY
ncbi:phage tail protein [Desulfocurvibacter africanus]|uniref:Prophage minor tail Z family protein n=1 Tax=Desulfocurvibacter africanus subsp. africanus str. Walvis Bay TaxID=690850 RepID=F3Z2T0_DESAF|nr:phage tail protein [Desulfocurvibacter africanus]EGJ50247.1 hypothetical protein Desaf_1918 [Desulfocurvibacter africanus subsp. africanus str. Walvis Bay]